MHLRAAVAVLAAFALGCGAGAESKPEPPPPRSGPEPEHILVAHVLVAFQGTGTKATRTQGVAEKLATDVLARAKKGEDFHKLIKELSDDSGDGVYGMVNLRVKPNAGEYPRQGMVAAFGDVGFTLEVGGIGMSSFDPQKSPYGWHIIKRVK